MEKINCFIFTTFTQMIMHLVYPPKFCITHVSNFSWVLQWSQEKSKTMQNLEGKRGGGGGEKKEIYIFREKINFKKNSLMF